MTHRPTPPARKQAEDLEDAFGSATAAGAGVAIAFKHLKERAMDDADLRADVVEFARRSEDAMRQLSAAGYYDRPHDPAQRVMLVALEGAQLADMASWIEDGLALASEYDRRVRGEDPADGLSPLEWALLPAVAPFLTGDSRRWADALLEWAKEQS